MTKKRKRRLARIEKAQYGLESALLTLRDDSKCLWANAEFGNLYYLVRLAKKAGV